MPLIIHTTHHLLTGYTHGLYLELMDHLKDTKYVNAFISSEEIIAALKGRKSADELANMKEAIKETLKIFDEVTKFLKPGVTEKQVSQFVLDLCNKKD